MTSSVLSTVLAATLAFAACPTGAFGPGLKGPKPASVVSQTAGNKSEGTISLAKKKTSNDRITTLNIQTKSHPDARSVIHHIEMAKKWGPKASEGSMTCIWAYSSSLCAIRIDQMIREVGASKESPSGTKDTKNIGYAIDGCVVCVRFDYAQAEKTVTAIFDDEGKLICVRDIGGDAYNDWDFHDDTLLSHTGGYSTEELMEPQAIGAWDENDRLSKQKELLDLAYKYRDLLQTDKMIDV